MQIIKNAPRALKARGAFNLSKSIFEKIFNHSVYVKNRHNRNFIRVFCDRFHIFCGHKHFFKAHFNALGNALFAVGHGADFACKSPKTAVYLSIGFPK